MVPRVFGFKFIRFVFINLMVVAVAYLFTMPTKNKSKEIASRLRLKYMDKSTLRTEITQLDRSNICLKDNITKNIPSFTDPANFAACIHDNKPYGFYEEEISIWKVGSSRGEYFCFEVHDVNKCRKLGGVYHENNHPCYCLIPYDF